MSESRALGVLEVLVHLTHTLPDKYVIGSAEIPDDLAIDVSGVELGDGWQTPLPEEQALTAALATNGLGAGALPCFASPQ